MSQYLVRWKFGPNSLLNNLNVETTWFQQFHSSKKVAVDHYTSLLFGASPSMAMTAEIFQLVQLIPGKPEPKDVEVVEDKEARSKRIMKEKEARKKQILKMIDQGYTRKEIADKLGIKYHAVYALTRPPANG
jgi:hypothetical protein